MKKILGLLLLVSSLFADCILISSPFPQVNRIVESSYYGQAYELGTTVGDKRINNFSDAYVVFLNTLSTNAKNHCTANKYSGIYNVVVNHSNYNSKIYFTASLDYVK